MKIIAEENPTLRREALRYERGRKTIKGTPAHIADVMNGSCWAPPTASPIAVRDAAR